MKIVILAHYFGFRDGQGRVNYEIAKKLLNEGHDLTVLAHECSEDLAKHSSMTFVKLQESSIPTQMMRNLSFARRSSNWLRRYRHLFDVIQANGFVSFSPVDVVATHFVHGAWLRSPFSQFKNPCTPYSLYQRAYTRTNALLEKRAFSQAKRVVAISPRVMSEIESIGISREKIKLILNGIDPTEFYPRPGDRRPFNLPDNVTLFLFSGDIRTHRKNLDGVLRAIASVPAIHLAVAGGTAGSPYPAMAHKLGIADRVHFLDQVKNMSDLMVATDAFIFPSRYDPLGLVVLEAMASGLPVITAKTTGASAVLDAPEWTIEDPEDRASLTQLILKLAEDPALRLRVGQRNRLIAINHSWDSMAASYISLYREICGALS